MIRDVMVAEYRDVGAWPIREETEGTELELGYGADAPTMISKSPTVYATSYGRLQLTARGRAALTKPAAETVRLLWRRWVSHGLIDEMSRIDAIKGQRSANVLTAVKPRRQTVATALVGCPVDEWVTVEDLFTTMRRGNLSPTISRSERGLWKLYLVDPE
ncbi:MAG: hypothetical protein ACT4NY_24780 [Pseudonocardiales bacterium]